MKKDILSFVYTILLSFFGSLCLASLLNICVTYAFQDFGDYPYQSPFSIACVMLCLLVCGAMTYLIVKSVKGFSARKKILFCLSGLIIIILSFYPFLIFWNYVIREIGALF